MEKEDNQELWQIIKECKFEGADDICPDYLCVICRRILMDAHNAPCGCRFCKECIHDYLKEDKRMCPSDSEYCKLDFLNIDRDIQKDRSTNVRVSKMLITCPSVGCQSQVELRQMANHLRICEYRPLRCPYFELGCTEEGLVSSQVREHLINEISSHSKLITNWMINSRNEAEINTRLVDKLQADNYATMTALKKEKFRSELLILELQEKSQEKEAISNEITILKQENLSLKQIFYTLKEDWTEKIDQISNLKDLWNKQSQDIEFLQRKIHETEELIKDFRNQAAQCQEMKQDIEQKLALSLSLQKDSTETTESMHKMRIRTMDISAKLSDIQKLIEKTNYGEFLWKIENWSFKSDQARNGLREEFFSEPFFTQKNGYKMRLAIWPNGNGAHTKGKFLSIFFYLLKGPNDDVLQWPFNQEIELTLIDQEKGVPYVSMKKGFNYPKSQALIRPKKGRNYFCRGFDEFIHLKTMWKNQSLYHNNRIFIKCSFRPNIRQNGK